MLRRLVLRSGRPAGPCRWKTTKKEKQDARKGKAKEEDDDQSFDNVDGAVTSLDQDEKEDGVTQKEWDARSKAFYEWMSHPNAGQDVPVDLRTEEQKQRYEELAVMYRKKQTEMDRVRLGLMRKRLEIKGKAMEALPADLYEKAIQPFTKTFPSEIEIPLPPRPKEQFEPRPFRVEDE